MHPCTLGNEEEACTSQNFVSGFGLREGQRGHCVVAALSAQPECVGVVPREGSGHFFCEYCVWGDSGMCANKEFDCYTSRYVSCMQRAINKCHGELPSRQIGTSVGRQFSFAQGPVDDVRRRAMPQNGRSPAPDASYDPSQGSVHDVRRKATPQNGGSLVPDASFDRSQHYSSEFARGAVSRDFDGANNEFDPRSSVIGSEGGRGPASFSDATRSSSGRGDVTAQARRPVLCSPRARATISLHIQGSSLPKSSQTLSVQLEGVQTVDVGFKYHNEGLSLTICNSPTVVGDSSPLSRARAGRVSAARGGDFPTAQGCDSEGPEKNGQCGVFFSLLSCKEKGGGA